MDVRVVRVFVYPVFIITGLFDRVEHLDEYGNNVNAPFVMNARNIVAWSPGKNGLGLPYDNSQQAINNLYNAIGPTQAEIVRIMGPPPRVPPVGPSNTFQIFWNIENRVPAAAYPISSNEVLTINLNTGIRASQVAVDATFLNSVMKFSLKLFYNI